MPLLDGSMGRDSSSTLVYGDDQHNGHWQGQSPCVCYYHQGCDQHNPLQTPVHHNASLLPRKPWYLSAIESILRRVAYISTTTTGYKPLRSTEDEMVELTPVINAGKSSPFTSDLPFDTGSITTLQPIHAAIPYHLAFYHLDCARRKLDTDVKLAFIPELSCHGTSVVKATTHRNMPCDWSSEIYFDNGTFLQKQELMYIMDARYTFWPSIKVRVCSHKAVRLGRVMVRDKDGLISVSTRITFPPWGRWSFDRGFYWNSSNGSSKNDLHMCRRCYSDLGYHVEVVGREVHVRFTCCRDLGAATQRSLPKWQNLLSGDWPFPKRSCQYARNSPHRRYDSPSNYDTYKRVLQAAKALSRPNLNSVTYMTRHGEFSPVQV